jgi:nicotinamide N-methyltransferase/methyltransferase
MSHFEPRPYLHEYYGDIGSENVALLDFLVDAYREIPRGGRLLDFGCGPTIYASLPAAERVDELHMCDFLEDNLDEIRRWARGEPDAFNWRAFTAEVLRRELGHPPQAVECDRREMTMRSKLRSICRGDARRKPPLQTDIEFDVLVSCFCLEAAATARSEWQDLTLNVCSLLRPGGSLILAAIKNADTYGVGSSVLPAVPIDEHDVIRSLEAAGFDEGTLTTSFVGADRASRHYEGLMFFSARKRIDAASRVPRARRRRSSHREPSSRHIGPR